MTTEIKEKLKQEQLFFMQQLRDKANINIVTCGSCGTVILHHMDKEDDIVCFDCGLESEQYDFPDLIY